MSDKITAEQLIKFTDSAGPDIEMRAGTAITVAESLISSYCRGRHINRAGKYRPGIDAVVMTVAARILANPEQIAVREQIGPYQYYRGQGFQGFTLVELAVLNRYRKRAI